MCFRKAAGVVPLLQGLTKVQIVSHSRFAAKMEFNTSHLGLFAELRIVVELGTRRGVLCHPVERQKK